MVDMDLMGGRRRRRNLGRIFLATLIVDLIAITASSVTPQQYADPKALPPESASLVRRNKPTTTPKPPEIAVTTCGGVARESKGILQTPGFPGPFKVPLRCRWIIDGSHTPGASIVVYLTQVFVTSGLRFESFAYLDADGGSGGGFGGWPAGGGNLGGGSSVGRQLILNSDSRPPALEEVGWIRSESPFLVATLNLDRLEGSHIRDLGPLLDVYGLNVTYELIPKSESVRGARCSLLECSVAGHCFGRRDLSEYYCSCFEGFFGEHCEYSRLCDPLGNASRCDNGGKCRHVGSTAIRCECPKGFTGPLCQSRVIGGPRGSQQGWTAEQGGCTSGLCSGQCPFDGKPESVCNCAGGFKANNADRSRFEGSIRLANATQQLRNSLPLGNPSRTLEATLEKQLTKFMKQQNLTKVDDLRISSIREEGDVAFSFLAGKDDGIKVRDALIRLAERVRLGSLSLVPSILEYRQEPALLLQSVALDQEKVPLGGEFIASCVAQGSPLMEFRWFKDGALVNHSRATRHMWQRLLGRDSHDSYTALLRVSGATVEDDGDLWCHVSDGGRQQCGAVMVRVAGGPPPTASVRPRAATLLKGENVTLVCMSPSHRRRHPERLGFFWTKNNALLPLAPGREVMEDLYPSGSILHIYNAQHSATYACHVVGGAASPDYRPHSYPVHVAVVDPDSVPLCPLEKAWDVHWPLTAPGQKALSDCPPFPRPSAVHSTVPVNEDHNSEGARANLTQSDPFLWSTVTRGTEPPGGSEASRECMLKETGVARWEEPDFSACVCEPIATLRDKFRRLTLGYEAISPVITLQELSDFLFSNLNTTLDAITSSDRTSIPDQAPFLLPGQGEPVVSFLAEIQGYLYVKSDIKKNTAELAASLPLLFQAIDLLMRHRCAIKNFQVTTKLILLTIRQSLLWTHVIASNGTTASATYPKFVDEEHHHPYYPEDLSSVHRSGQSKFNSRRNGDPTKLFVHLDPIAYNDRASVYGEYSMHYPKEGHSHPSWFSDKVEAWLTTLTAGGATVSRGKRDDMSRRRDPLEPAGDEGRHYNTSPVQPSLTSTSTSTLDLPIFWSLTVFRSVTDFLPQRYVARKRDGADAEYELGSRIISLEVVSQSGHRLHQAFQHPSLPIPSHPSDEKDEGHSTHHRTPVGHPQSPTRMHASIVFSLTSPFPSPPPSSAFDEPEQRTFWNITCGRFITMGTLDDSGEVISARRGHTWKIDACVVVLSPEAEAQVMAWRTKDHRIESSKANATVTCHCNQPGTYATLFVMKKLTYPWDSIGQTTSGITGHHSVVSAGWWVLLPASGGPPGAKGVAGVGCGACLALSLLSLVSLLCLRPLIKLLLGFSTCVKQPVARRKQVHNSSSSCPPQPTVHHQQRGTTLGKRCRGHLPSCLHLLKIQCCATVFGAMAVFMYAIQMPLHKSSYPYITTCLEGFLLTGMSSHLSKVLIVYAEVVTAAGAAGIMSSDGGSTSISTVGGGNAYRDECVVVRGGPRGAASSVFARRLSARSALANLPRLSHLRPTILGIVTGIPVLTVLASHLSHQTYGWNLPSWWLALGTSLFNVFVTSACLITLLFAFLCTSLLRRLRNLLMHLAVSSQKGVQVGQEHVNIIAIQKMQKMRVCRDIRIIKRRVAFLKRAAAIFTSMLIMEIASVLYINIPDDAIIHYIFSISSAWLGVVIFVCYVVKSEAPLGPRKLFRSLRALRVSKGKMKATTARGRSGTGPATTEAGEEEEEEEEEESDCSDSLDSPLTLFMNPCSPNIGSSDQRGAASGAMTNGRAIDLVECGKRGGGDGACSDTGILFSVTQGAGEVGNKDGVERRDEAQSTSGENLALRDASIEIEATTSSNAGLPGVKRESLNQACSKEGQNFQYNNNPQLMSQCLVPSQKPEMMDAVLLYSEWKQQELAVRPQRPPPGGCHHPGKGSFGGTSGGQRRGNRDDLVCHGTTGTKTRVEVNPRNKGESCLKVSFELQESHSGPNCKTPTSTLKRSTPKHATLVIESNRPMEKVAPVIPPDPTQAEPHVSASCVKSSTVLDSQVILRGSNLLTMQESIARIPSGGKDVTASSSCGEISDGKNQLKDASKNWKHNEFPESQIEESNVDNEVSIVLRNETLDKVLESNKCTLQSSSDEEWKGAGACELIPEECDIHEGRRCPEGSEELGDGEVVESGSSEVGEEVECANEDDEDMDGMLDRITQDLDFLLNRSTPPPPLCDDDVDLSVSALSSGDPNDMLRLRTLDP